MKKNKNQSDHRQKLLDNLDYWERRRVINQLDKGIKKVSKLIKQKRNEVQQFENAKKATDAKKG
jgi:hypothetical protein